MAARLAGDAIHVTSIAPGAFASEMNRAARDHGDEVARRIPAGRIGVAEDMAGAAIYLASRAGDYVPGTKIGRAHVLTPVHNSHILSRLLLGKIQQALP